MGESQTILITGASRGLGLALARHLCETGTQVIGLSRSGSKFQHTNYIDKRADLTVEKDVVDLFLDLRLEKHRLDVLINNAGCKADSLVALTSSQQADEMMQTNFLGTFRITREAVKIMKRQRFGRIINISSMAVPLGSNGAGIYAATKAAIDQFSYSLARECASDDITVNTVGISIYDDSDMVNSLGPQQLEIVRTALLKPAALNIQEVAHAVQFFTSPQAAKITNQVVYFGGLR